MSVLIWGLLALAAGFGVLTFSARAARPRVPPLPSDVDLPTTPLQRLARRGLVAGAVLAMGAGGLFMAYGPERLDREDGPRLLFTALLLAIAVVFLAVTVQLKAWSGRSDGTLDERDRAILDRAPAWQARAMLVTLAIWMIGLAEHFHGAGVPVFYLYLIFWSVWVVDLLALPVGILVGYRRS
jgi:hypothetical protein